MKLLSPFSFPFETLHDRKDREITMTRTTPHTGVEIRNSACFLNYLVPRTIDAAERVSVRRKRVKNFRTLAGRRPGSFRRRGDNERKGVEKED